MKTTQDILEELIRDFIEVNGIGELLKLIAHIVDNDNSAGW